MLSFSSSIMVNAASGAVPALCWAASTHVLPLHQQHALGSPSERCRGREGCQPFWCEHAALQRLHGNHCTRAMRVALPSARPGSSHAQLERTEPLMCPEIRKNICYSLWREVVQGSFSLNCIVSWQCIHFTLLWKHVKIVRMLQWTWVTSCKISEKVVTSLNL